jgi:hypothetical protein
MKPPRPALRELARRLLEDEASGHDEPGVAAEEVIRKLRERLVDLIGARGFEALLRRALRLAKTEAPELDPVEVTPGGGLAGLPRVTAGRTGDEAIDAPVSLLAQLLELLAAFIGVDLTSRLALKSERDDSQPGRGSEET